MYVVDNFGKMFGGEKAAQREHDDASRGPDSVRPEASNFGPRSQWGGTQQPMSVMAPATVIHGNPAADAQPGVDSGSDEVTLPLLGRRSVNAHQRLLGVLLAASLAGLLGTAGLALRDGNRITQQITATGVAQTQAQRLAKSASQALVGNADAFPEVKESAQILTKNVNGLKSGDAELGLVALAGPFAGEIQKVGTDVESADRNANLIVAQQEALSRMRDSLRSVNRSSADLLDVAEAVATAKLQQNAPNAEIAVANQLVMLTQRIGKSASELQSIEGANVEAVFLLGKDLTTFRGLTEALLNGSPELRVAAARDQATRDNLSALLAAFSDAETKARAVLSNLQGLISAQEAQKSIVDQSGSLRQNLETLQSQLAAQAGVSPAKLLVMALAGLAALLCAAAFARALLLDSKQRQEAAERRTAEAAQEEQEAKRVNDANQAAILRLMNELQTVAEGDLTQEATVTEDITGAIADSVNYTVEELRLLVGNVQKTATRVAHTTAQVENTSTVLLGASTEQLREIRETGQSVLDMASRINGVSTQAQESAAVARQSLEAADSGLKAVQNAIGGMNSIRDQIQDTSKRIKRLGESSQEIGEITELISDITEQTNVLALNAAIQAASAGEAGRGFSVVAEEVQRLAERSADATRQIAALVKAIQTDTQDAVAAMERSTQGVVEGARLSDSAGTAIGAIDRVSRRLAELIGDISSAAFHEAELANVAAGNIQHIFAVTEQTSDGTRSTAQQVRDLSRMADELRQSVSRFKIA